jgi:hypothetical protein
MPYQKVKATSYRWPVPIRTAGDGGVQIEETFDAVFRRVTRPEMQQLADRGDEQLVRGVLVGWSGIIDGQGEEIPFSEAARDEMMLTQSFMRAVIEAFYLGVNGGKAGN